MIKKSSYPILFISLLGCFVFHCSKTNSTKKIATSPELNNPYQHMWADKDQLFISDGKGPEGKKTTIHVYSLKDFSFQANFGGSGEEPGKFLVAPDHSVTLIVEPNRLIVGSGGRVSFFTRDGEFKSEIKHNRDSFFYRPIGKMYIGRQGIRENNVDYYRVNLYDENLNFIKEICRKENMGNPFSGDFIYYAHEEKIYISKINNDFIIDIYDITGNRLNRIQYDYENIKVSQAHKDEHLNILTSRPGWEQYFDNRDAMMTFYKNRIKYPEFFPAIFSFYLADEWLYILTHKQIENTRELWIMDLDGSILQKRMIPFHMRTTIRPWPYTIRNKKMYQLIQDEQTQKWDFYMSLID